jgi:ATP-binding cassette subfamily B protein
MMSKCTTIVIAHRLATVKSMDQIAVINKGELIAIGTHEELLLNNPLYTELAHLQFIDS